MSDNSNGDSYQILLRLRTEFRSRKRTAINQEYISHQLEQAASSTENQSPSFKGAGLQLGYQPTTLYKINQAACHAIAERYTAYRRKLREKRLQEYREEIRQIALYLQAEQMSLTQKHIGRYLAQPAILRDPTCEKSATRQRKVLEKSHDEQLCSHVSRRMASVLAGEGLSMENGT